MRKKLPEHKIVPLRIPNDMYRGLRKLAYLNEVSMAQMIRDAIEFQLKNRKKLLTNSDIAIY